MSRDNFLKFDVVIDRYCPPGRAYIMERGNYERVPFPDGSTVLVEVRPPKLLGMVINLTD